jgi:predicted DNA-binding transcriptional regulator AlpA
MHKDSIHDAGFLRLAQIIGSPKKGIVGLLPISRSSWYAGIKKGLYPAPVKVGPKTSVWRVSEVREELEKL